MSVALRSFDLAEGFDRILKAIDEDGAVIVRDFISDELRSRIFSQLAPHAGAVSTGTPGGDGKQAFCGSETKRFSGLAAKAPAFAEVIDHDLMHAWAEKVFKADYWINTGQAMIVGPGSTDQYLHRDAGNWPLALAGGRDGPEATISIMLALSEFTAENGATRVVPGSHKWEDFSRKATPSEVTQAVMPAGAALLYTGRAIHGAGANVTADGWRFGIHLSFVLGQLTPEEALPLTVPWEVAQHFSNRVQHMLGFYSHRTFDPGWPILWTKDYRELRDSLEPSGAADYVSAGARALPSRTPTAA